MKDKELILEQYKKYQLELLEPLGTSSTKRYRTLCKCGTEFMSRPSDIKRGATKSCGHCHDPMVGIRIGSLTVMIYIPDKANGCQVVCKCDCGNWIPMMSGGRFNSGQIKSCGHCNDPKIGYKIGKLTVKEVIPARHKGCKVICDCECGRTYGPIKFGTLSRNRPPGYIVTCGQCNIPNIGDRYGQLTITKITNIRSGGCTVDTICDCGNESKGLKHGVLTSGNTKTCGFCKIPNIGEKYNKLTITKVRLNKITREINIETICDCGNKYIPKKSCAVIGGNTKSCGHCRDAKVGDRFGNLTIIKVKTNKSGGCKVKSICDCGQETKYYDNYNLVSGKNVTCGNCKLRRNSILTSNIALKLHNMIEKIVGHKCEHNYKIGKKYFDIVDLQNKIAIEYDEYHWHREMRDTSKKEISDTKLALRHGFKMLRIRASSDLPTEAEIKKVITNHFQHGYKQHTLTTTGWKQMDK